MDLFDEEVITPELEKRFLALSQELQAEVMASFSGAAESVIVSLQESEEDSNLLEKLREIIDTALAEAEKKNWRGLPLLW